MSFETAQPVRTLLVSDVHLGAKHARVDECLHFLQRYVPENLYLVGDFLDAWKINSGWCWSDSCDAMVRHLVTLVERGTKIYYTPGNHDSFLRQPTVQAMLPAGFPLVEVADEFVFESKNGWKFLITHGDLFDFFETRAQWISKGSSWFYDTCLSANRWFQCTFLDRQRNPYGACAVIKGRVKRAVKFISGFESKLMHHANARGCDGVICGHIHTPVLKHDKDLLYFNTGDWVENCTGLVEHHDGSFQLVTLYQTDQHVNLKLRVSARESDSDVIPVAPPIALGGEVTAPSMHRGSDGLAGGPEESAVEHVA